VGVPRCGFVVAALRRVWRPRPRSFRTHLVLLVVGAVLPVAVFSVFAAARFAVEAKRGVEQRLRVTADGLAAALDKTFEKSIAALQVLAASRSLDDDDLVEFYEEAQRAREPLGWWTVALIAPDGTHLLNLLQPLGTPLRSVADRRYFRDVIRTRAVVVTELLANRIDGRLATAIAVPVVRDGAVKYVVLAGWHAERFASLVGSRESHGEWTRAIVDGEGVIVARSRAPEQFVGRKATADFLERTAQSTHGFYSATTIDSAKVYGAFTRSAVSGWTAAVAVPATAVEAASWGSVTVTILAGIGLFAVGVLATLLVGRRFARSITEATAAAEALASGGAPRAPASSVIEVRRLGMALDVSARLLDQRERERTEALRRAHDARAVEEEARREAEQANRAKDEFLAMLGHELRNPIAAITNATAVLERIGATTDLAVRSRAILKRQARQLTRLIDDLLDVSRLAAGKLTLSRGPVDLLDVAHRCVGVLDATGRFDARDVDLSGTPAWVDADAARLEQIVTNLLLNASTHTPPGGSIRVRVGAENAHAVLRVIDTGSGIAAELLPRVFDLFIQGERTHHGAQGLGIGLTLVRRLTELHGGRVEAHSAGPGRGSEFTVSLPRIEPARVDARDEPDHAKPTRRRILVIEDNADAREALRTLLEIAGHEVYEAAGGEAGLRMAVELRPDVAIIDLGLPDVDGLEIARKLTTAAGPRPRLVALTGYGRSEDQHRAREAGFDEHLTKPVDPDRLLRIVTGDTG
jgi:signal transduction histidine kinase/CheY-like chemotaxis protein